MSFKELIGKAQAGEREAMDRILEEMEPILRKVADGCHANDRADASVSDLIQEARLRAWERIGQFEGGRDDEETRAKLRAWLAQIVRRLALNAQRAGNAQKRRDPDRAQLRIRAAGSADASNAGVDPPAPIPTASAELRKDEELAAVRAALERIADSTSREVLSLCFFDGLSFREIAERLGISFHQVRERYHASMKTLERDLRDQL
jgi:RNA polymerase sigma-70 factor (ECF subfamily)